jgi:hypothetical protein
MKRPKVSAKCFQEHWTEAGISDPTQTVGRQLQSWAWWLTPIIPATWTAEIRRITIQGQIFHKTPSPK